MKLAQKLAQTKEKLCKVIPKYAENVNKNTITEILQNCCKCRKYSKIKNLTNHFKIDSAATSREEIGNPPHYGTAGKLRQVGIPLIPHRAEQMTKADYDAYDYLIGMDSMNIRNIMRIIGKDTQKKVYRLLDFSDSPRDIADPWYTGNFDRTYEDSVEGCGALLEKIKQEYDL